MPQQQQESYSYDKESCSLDAYETEEMNEGGHKGVMMGQMVLQAPLSLNRFSRNQSQESARLVTIQEESKGDSSSMGPQTAQRNESPANIVELKIICAQLRVQSKKVESIKSLIEDLDQEALIQQTNCSLLDQLVSDVLQLA